MLRVRFNVSGTFALGFILPEISYAVFRGFYCNPLAKTISFITNQGEEKNQVATEKSIIQERIQSVTIFTFATVPREPIICFIRLR